MQGMLFVLLKIYFHFDRATLDDLIGQRNNMMGLDISVCYDPLHYSNAILMFFPIECIGNGTM